MLVKTCDAVANEGFDDLSVSSTLTTGTLAVGSPVNGLLNRYSATLGNLIIDNPFSTNPNLPSDSKVGAWSPSIY